MALQEAGHQHLPHQKDRIDKGQYGAQSRAPREQQQEQQKQSGQQRLAAQAKMIRHGDGGDRAAAVADHDVGRVARLEYLVLCQRTVQAVDRIGLRAPELPAEDLHPTALLTGAHQSRIHNVALIGGQYPRPHAFRIAIAQRTLEAGRQKQQRDHERQRQRHRNERSSFAKPVEHFFPSPYAKSRWAPALTAFQKRFLTTGKRGSKLPRPLSPSGSHCGRFTLRPPVPPACCRFRYYRSSR